jgi:hypothetical protein
MKHERIIEGPLSREARRQAALSEARARFYDRWQALTAELQAEERRIEREFA